MCRRAIRLSQILSMHYAEAAFLIVSYSLVSLRPPVASLMPLPLNSRRRQQWLYLNSCVEGHHEKVEIFTRA